MPVFLFAGDIMNNVILDLLILHVMLLASWPVVVVPLSHCTTYVPPGSHTIWLVYPTLNMSVSFSNTAWLFNLKGESSIYCRKVPHETKNVIQAASIYCRKVLNENKHVIQAASIYCRKVFDETKHVTQAASIYCRKVLDENKHVI